MSSPPDVDRAADLLERLLTDATFRGLFRQDPEGALLAYGLAQTAGELTDSSKALHTIEIRESKSPLAGLGLAAMAAALHESSSAAELLRERAEQGAFHGATRHAVSEALTRVMPAVPRRVEDVGARADGR